jgi:Coenzyme PQQ synthesis protein D (PqqD)
MVESLSLADLVVRSDGVIESEVDGEVVALDVEKGTVYSLNRVGSRVWNLLTVPTPIADICSTLLKEYKVESSDCEREVLDLLEDLRAERLIAVYEER